MQKVLLSFSFKKINMMELHGASNFKSYIIQFYIYIVLFNTLT